jgi:DNA-directed RNA polymerase beta subunit
MEDENATAITQKGHNGAAPAAPKNAEAAPREGDETQPDRVIELSDLQPQRVYPHISTVRNDALQKRDMLSFISAAVDQNGLVGHNINGFNALIEYGINRIMMEHFNNFRMVRNERTATPADLSRKSFKIHLQFNDVKIGKPTCPTYLTGQFADLYPARARLTGQSYSGPVTLGATVIISAYYADGRVEEKTAEIPPFQISTFPIMKGSSRCHTHMCTRQALKEMGEDPSDPGGYFIAKRGEWVVDLLENIRYNSLHIHKRMKPNEHVRAEFLSQPGGAFENSSQIRLRYMQNGQITVEINSTKFEKVYLPFFIIYRLFGVTSDREIASTIVFDIADTRPMTLRMMDILSRAFQRADDSFTPLIPELNREKLVQMTAERVAKYLTNPTHYLSSESAIQYLNEDLLRSLDRVFLPNMGQTEEARIRKLRFFGLIIHKTLLCHMNALDATDRDSVSNKRAHGAGVSLAKSFKTQVNNSAVGPLFRAFRRELKNNSFESITPQSMVDTFRNSVTQSDLNRAMEQSITSGNKTIVVRRRAAINRVSSQALERKNALNTLSALRTVVTQNASNASKQTERADMMRRVHPTYTGFICIAQSADTGENVGMRKQLAITASICSAGEALPLKLRLLADPVVHMLDTISSVEMSRRQLSRLFVNGEWIGFCDSAYELVERYRALRRENRGVDGSTTIYWNPLTDEVEFWLDSGRLSRTLLIVDNNIDEYDAGRMAAYARRVTGSADGRPAPNYADHLDGIVCTDDAGRLMGVYFLEGDRFFALNDDFTGPAPDAPTLDYAEALVRAGHAEAQPTPEAITEMVAAFRRGGDRAGDDALSGGAPGGDDALSGGAPGGPGATTPPTPSAPLVEFVQNIRFTPEHARAIVEGRLSMDDLIADGIAERITPEEQENCLIAESIDVLRENRHNVAARFTHCEVEQAVFGLAALVSPYGNHTQPARVTYETNQGRQTGGWYVLNFPYRTDKNRFFQFYNEIPLVRTFTHKLVPANGMNVCIAYMPYGGDNQEDSAIVNQASADRGLFSGAFFRYEMADLEKGESFCCPDALTTKNLKPNAAYEKLVDGFVRVGSVVRFGDVLIGRVAKLGRGSRGGADDKYLTTDRSVVYRLKEPAVVEAVLRPRGANDELFGLVKLRYERPLRTGDKMSSRSGNKSIVALMLPQSRMPFTESGLTPDMIINTHSFPSRMTIGQLIETSRGKVCARRGVIEDGTAFLPVDHEANTRELLESGFRYNACERMYNATGEYFDTAIFIGPTAEQRLQKFVLDDEQSVAGNGPTDATTGQPLGGRLVAGGLRLGEMEGWCLESHGSMLNLYEKCSMDSDGRKLPICRGCASIAVLNEFHRIYECKTCGELADIEVVESSKSAILLMEELNASGCSMRLGLRPREFERRSTRSS